MPLLVEEVDVDVEVEVAVLDDTIKLCLSAQSRSPPSLSAE